MRQRHTLALKGCAPEPLMNYLKALGIFRVVAQQRDPDALAWWHLDTFHLQSVLDRDELMEFFLDEYQPSPIVSPWNGGSGFQPGDKKGNLSLIAASDAPRLAPWQEAIAIGQRIVDGILASIQHSNGEPISDRRLKSELKNHKEAILARCRALFPDEALDWLDATYVLAQDGPKYPPLLGSGGNDGRLEFSTNFAQNALEALGLDGKRKNVDARCGRLKASLYLEGSPSMVRKRTTGFFHPGSVGGANATAGFDGEALSNPWDFVLMFEGVLMFAGSISRRLSAHATSKAVFPFTVDTSAAGYGTSADSEYRDATRGEFWIPLWERPSSLSELKHLVQEGRAQLGRKQAATGSDFARAVAGLGTERGVTQFHRYGFMVRNGMSYLATPLGRFHTRSHDPSTTDCINLLMDLDSWLYSLRRALPVAGRALGAIEQAIMDLTQRGQKRDLQNVLVAVGRAEKWLARSSSSLRERIPPFQTLSNEWMELADDGSGEFRLARAMSAISVSIKDNQILVGPIRENLEAIRMGPRIQWQEDSTTFAWKAGSDWANMLGVLQRRCLEGRRQGLEHAPLNSRCFASLWDIADFINGTLDVNRIVELALPLSFIRWPSQVDMGNKPRSAWLALPATYATLKLTLLPDEFKQNEIGIRMEPRMLSLLRAGRVREAHQIAFQRLKSSGLRPLTPDPGIRGPAHRLAAALLFPISRRAYRQLGHHALLDADNESLDEILEDKEESSHVS